MNKNNESCNCAEPEYQWQMAKNEEGWHCGNCEFPIGGDPNGFNPQLDRDETFEKIHSVLFALVESGVIGISNNDHANCLVYDVGEMCEKENQPQKSL